MRSTSHVLLESSAKDRLKRSGDIKNDILIRGDDVKDDDAGGGGVHAIPL